MTHLTNDDGKSLGEVLFNELSKDMHSVQWATAGDPREFYDRAANAVAERAIRRAMLNESNITTTAFEPPKFVRTIRHDGPFEEWCQEKEAQGVKVGRFQLHIADDDPLAKMLVPPTPTALPKRVKVHLRMNHFVPWHERWVTPIDEQWCIHEGDGAHAGCIVLTHIPSGLCGQVFDASEAVAYNALIRHPAPVLAGVIDPHQKMNDAERKAVQEWLDATCKSLGLVGFAENMKAMRHRTRDLSKDEFKAIHAAVSGNGERPSEAAARLDLMEVRVRNIVKAVSEAPDDCEEEA